jgi:hypothetical protein
MSGGWFCRPGKSPDQFGREVDESQPVSGKSFLRKRLGGIGIGIGIAA